MPRPRLHLIRFHGVLAPNAKLRSKIVPAPPEHATETATDQAPDQGKTPRMSWARLLLTTSTILVTVQVWFTITYRGEGWVGHCGDFAASTLLLTLLFAFTFRFLSDFRAPYQHVWGGALVGASLFSVGKLLIGWYLGYSQLGSAYGAAGSLVVFLAWMYDSAQIFLFGAELVRVRLELHQQ